MPYRRKDSLVWWASYTNTSGKRIRQSTGTMDRKEAAALEAKWKLEAFQEQKWDKGPDRTFDELMLAYLDETQDVKRCPIRDKCSLKHLFPAFTGNLLSEIRPEDVRGYISKRRRSGAAASTINKEVGLLSSAINYARREWGWDVSNSASGCKQREPEGRVRWLQQSEAFSLITEAEKNSRAPHLANFIRLALNTGCRKGELLGLEWSRVDLKQNFLVFEAKHTKTEKRRSIPLNKDARQVIIDRARFRAEHCPDSPWVFSHKDGSQILDVKNSFSSACKSAGIDNFRIHDLRHTAAAWLVTSGVPLIEVRDILGHQTIQMTERYAHLAPENLRVALSSLEGMSRFGHVGDEKKMKEAS
jgi:integrase